MKSRNPLNFINNFSEVSLELLDELRGILDTGGAGDDKSEIAELAEMVKANLEKVRQHGQRADGIVKSMLMHSRESSGEWRAADINSIMEDSLNLAYYGNRSERENQVALEKSFDPAAGEVEMFPQDVTRGLLNIVANGIYATLRHQTKLSDAAYEPALKIATKDLGNAVEIIVRDNGEGIAPGDQGKGLQPVLHDEAAWRRHRAWSFAEPRHHRQATRRDDRFRQQGRRVHGIQGDASTFSGKT